MLVAQALEDPLGSVPLLRRPNAIVCQDPVDNTNERIQFGSRRRTAPPVAGRHRKRQHLCNRSRIYPKPTRCLTPTDPLDPNRVAEPAIQIHELHSPSPLRSTQGTSRRRSFTPAQPDFPAASLRDFVSGVTVALVRPGPFNRSGCDGQTAERRTSMAERPKHCRPSEIANGKQVLGNRRAAQQAQGPTQF